MSANSSHLPVQHHIAAWAFGIAGGAAGLTLLYFVYGQNTGQHVIVHPLRTMVSTAVLAAGLVLSSGLSVRKGMWWGFGAACATLLAMVLTTMLIAHLAHQSI